MRNKRIVLIGAGNVAHALAPALLKAGLNLCQIYSHTVESARELGMKTGITYTSETYAIYPDGDIYIFCVSDDALPSLIKRVVINHDALVLHTSGSLPLQVLKPLGKRYGVLYPLQTFTKKRVLDFSEIPLCIEAVNPATLKDVRELAGILSNHIEEISSDRRKILHLAAVFANNFVNHLYTLADGILQREGLDFNLLRPLIFETAHKVLSFSPEQAQTGPAKRGDEGILSMHKALLKNDSKLLNLYTILSDSIRQTEQKRLEIKAETGEKTLMPTLW